MTTQSDDKPSGIYYSDYLQLDKVLNAQVLESEKFGATAHDEMLFIITHQTYELWFKQIVYELDAVIDVFDDPIVEDKKMGRVLHLLARIRKILRVLVHQIDIIQSITPHDFLEFRDLLVPASGFQSTRFKQIEIKLGIKRSHRIAADCEFFKSRLSKQDLGDLDELETKNTIHELTDRWLARMPFLKFQNFDFWKEYRSSVEKMLNKDQAIIEKNVTLTDREKQFQINDLTMTRTKFDSIFSEEKYEKLRSEGHFRLSHQGFLGALFVNLYRDEPMLYAGFRYLTQLVEIDELMTNWRQRHAVMVQRMLGTKIGTGGSSGHDYLNATTANNRAFTDLFNISTYLIPREDLPVLPDELVRALGFFFRGDKQRLEELERLSLM